MSLNVVPTVFLKLQSSGCISMTDLVNTQDGFWVLCKSVSEILARKGIFDLTDADGNRLACDSFFDDWFLYALPDEQGHVYSLLKLREQENDSKGDSFADGDTPGVTISFIAFSCEALLDCLMSPTDENRQRLESEIDRVVARRGQRHHKALKRYFINSSSQGAYLVADLYAKHIASFAENGELNVPELYMELSKKQPSRLVDIIDSLNQAAGRVVCDHTKLYFQNVKELTEYEIAAILATHTGNASVYSFAAEVEYHARFLLSFAKIKFPFFRRSIYESAVRADMTIGEVARGMTAPYYRENSKILKRHFRLHNDI